MFYSKFPTHSKQCSTLGNINVFFPVYNMESGAPKAGAWCRVRMPESESIVKRALILHVPITTVPLKRTNSSLN